ncbi:hypothetical protein ABD91_20510 [Lysinibacillus sphaericus]|uniref:hypothetical protein n=1 Tax=Lysinibacillus sphaericus TaxID=1421 RepID=UPI0018CCD9AE|nr:hypothetical protein [Lysinibacillus sphaericus]MBG9693127.1 hypothetical protein [Lysinibacillus sphaericus]
MKITCTGQEISNIALVATTAAQSTNQNVEVEHDGTSITVTPNTSVNEFFELLKVAKEEQELAYQEDVKISKEILLNLFIQVATAGEDSIQIDTQLVKHLDAALSLHAVVLEKMEEMVDFEALVKELALDEELGEELDGCPSDCPCKAGEAFESFGGLVSVNTNDYPPGTPVEQMVMSKLQEMVAQGVIPYLPDGVVIQQMPPMFPPPPFMTHPNTTAEPLSFETNAGVAHEKDANTQGKNKQELLSDLTEEMKKILQTITLPQFTVHPKSIESVATFANAVFEAIKASK